MHSGKKNHYLFTGYRTDDITGIARRRFLKRDHDGESDYISC